MSELAKGYLRNEMFRRLVTNGIFLLIKWEKIIDNKTFQL